MAVFPFEMNLLFVVLMGILCTSQAHTYTVGGYDGWTLRPSQNYTDWAKGHHFLINDILEFKYKKSHDSVLVVSKDDFTKCNKDNPIKTLKDGDSKVKFSKSGPLFFISGHNQNCEMGQKLIVVVISPHHHNTTHSAPPLSPETLLQPPSSSPTPPSTAHLPPANQLSDSPSPSPTSSHTPKAESPKNSNGAPPHHHRTPTPQSYPVAYPPHHAPAPAPSAAACHFGSSFVLLVGISFAVIVISVGFV